MPADDDRITTDVFAIPVADRYLVYAPLRRVAFVANAAAVNLLDRLRHESLAAIGESERSFLDWCRAIRLTGKEGDYPIAAFGAVAYQPIAVTLFLTTRCNLRCTYCYASAGDHPAKDMSLPMAKRGIDTVCRNALALGQSHFGVGYHGGGEPTTAWRVLVESFEYAQQTARTHGLTVDGSMATNGMLSTQQRQWVMRNLSSVNVSFDGLPQAQDRQRPRGRGGASSPRVLETLRTFDAAGYPYGIRMTVTAASVEQLPAGVEYLLTHTRPAAIQVEPVYGLGRGRADGLAVHPDAFVAAFRRAKQVADSGQVALVYSAARVDVLTNRFCRSCGEGFSLTPDGHVTACYEAPDPSRDRGGHFILGRYDARQAGFRIDKRKLGRLRRGTVEGISWCRDCFCKWHCAGDCAYKANHAAPDKASAANARCDITRALTLDQIMTKIAQHGGTIWAEPK